MIILIILFIIGIIYSLRINNKLLLNINIFLLLISILYKLQNKEHYAKCSSKINNDKCLLGDDNIEFICEKYGHKSPHCNSLDTIYEPTGSLEACFNKFGNITNYYKDSYKYIPTCNDIGVLLYTKNNEKEYAALTPGNYEVQVNSSTTNEEIQLKDVIKIRLFNNYTVTLYSGDPNNQSNKKYKIEYPTLKEIADRHNDENKIKLYYEYNIPFTTGGVTIDSIGTLIVGKMSKDEYVEWIGKTISSEFILNFETNETDEPENNNLIKGIESCKNIFNRNNIIPSGTDSKKDQVEFIITNNRNLENGRDLCLSSNLTFSEINDNKTNMLFLDDENKSIIQKIPVNYKRLTNRQSLDQQTIFDAKIHYIKYIPDTSCLDNSKNIIKLDLSKKTNIYKILLPQKKGDKDCPINMSSTNILQHIGNTNIKKGFVNGGKYYIYKTENLNTNNKYSIRECSDLCNDNASCLAFEYSNEAETNNDYLGKCVLLNTQFNYNTIGSDDHNNTTDIYAKEYKNPTTDNVINETDYQLTKTKISQNDYLNIDKIQQSYNILQNTKQNTLKKDSRIDLVTIYQNPDNIISIKNINIKCSSIKITFSKPIQISTILFSGNLNNGQMQNLNDYVHIVNSSVSNVADLKQMNNDLCDIYTFDYINQYTLNNIFENDDDIIIDNNIVSFNDDIMTDNILTDDTTDNSTINSSTLKLPSNSPFIEFEFKQQHSTKEQVVQLNNIVIYVYNKNYIPNICSTDQLSGSVSENDFYPIKFELYKDSNKSLLAEIVKSESNIPIKINNFLPTPPANLNYDNIKDVGIHNYYRGWVNFEEAKISEPSYCRFIEHKDSDNVYLKCNTHTMGNMTKEEAKKKFFIKTNQNEHYDMCYCKQDNDSSKIECKNMGTSQNIYSLPYKLENSCNKYSTRELKKMINNNNRQIDENVLKHKINESKYIIHAGFTITQNNKEHIYLFKNTKLHGNPVILYNIYSKDFKKIDNLLPGIVCNATFPGLKFKDDKIDRIDTACVANHLKNYVYFFKYEDGVGYVVKYDLRNMKISCDYKYPRKVADEFKIKDKKFLLNPITNAIYININNKSKIILFTATTYIEIYINDTVTNNPLTFSSILTNNIWLDINFADIDSIISCGSNNKLLFFYNNYHFTYLDYESKEIINKYQYQLISYNFNDIWKINPTKYNNLIINSLNKNKKRLDFKCPEFQEDIEIRLKNELIINQNKKQEIQNKIKQDNESIIKLQNKMNKQENILLTTVNILNESINKKQQLINYKQILKNSTSNDDEKQKLNGELNNLTFELNQMVNNKKQLKKEKLDNNYTTKLINNACDKNSNLLDINSYI